jgi:hypothetical protein
MAGTVHEHHIYIILHGQQRGIRADLGALVQHNGTHFIWREGLGAFFIGNEKGTFFEIDGGAVGVEQEDHGFFDRLR